jgi:hypothetical protein
MSQQGDMVEDFNRSRRAMEHFNAGLLEYQGACIRCDWDAAEKARQTVIGCIDSYLDNLAAAYKRTETP